MASSISRRIIGQAAVLGAALANLGGCTVGVTGGAVAVAALGAGAGEVLRAGTEYTLTGRALRTFTASVDTVHEATRTALNHMAFTVEREEAINPGRRIVARAIDRTIEIELQPLSPAATRVELLVSHGALGRDRATASEIITQIEFALITRAKSAP
jgi:hypothetical protein